MKEEIHKLVNDALLLPYFEKVQTVYLANKQQYCLELELRERVNINVLLSDLGRVGELVILNYNKVVLTDKLVNIPFSVSKNDLPIYKNYHAWLDALALNDLQTGVLDWLNNVLPLIHPIRYEMSVSQIIDIGDALFSQRCWAPTQIPNLILDMCKAFTVSSDSLIDHEVGTFLYWENRAVATKKAA